MQRDEWMDGWMGGDDEHVNLIEIHPHGCQLSFLAQQCDDVGCGGWIHPHTSALIDPTNNVIW